MTAPDTRARGRNTDQLLLITLAVTAAALFAATPALIVPYPHNAPWYESSALFPRLTLGLALLGGLGEMLVRRRGGSDRGGSEELDSSSANLRQAAMVVVLFMAYLWAIPWLGYATCSFLFICLTGMFLGLRLRETLVLAVLMSAGMWLVFVRVLKVAFGHGLLP